MAVSRESDGHIGSLVTRLADGLARLLIEHLELAKLELKGEAKEVARLVGRLALVIPFVIVGYAFLCAGICLLLREWLPLAEVVLAVGVVNLAVAGLLVYGVTRRLGQQRVLGETLQELNSSVAILASNGDLKRP